MAFLPESHIRARRPDGSECIVDLVALENALEGGEPCEYYFLPDSGQIVLVQEDDLDADDGVEGPLPDDLEALPLDPIDSRTHFKWMEEFIESVHSVPAQTALLAALRKKKPFRNFTDALIEYPKLRQRWFQFEAQKTKAEAVSLIESFDWEVLEVLDSRTAENVAEEIDPVTEVPATTGEYEWILRGAWQIAAKGGRTQLALLLKGSRNK